MKYTYLYPIMRLKGMKIRGPHSFEKLRIYYSCETRCYVLFMANGCSYCDSKGRTEGRACSSSGPGPGNNTVHFYALGIPSVSRTNYQLSCWTFFFFVLQNVFRQLSRYCYRKGQVYLRGTCYLLISHDSNSAHLEAARYTQLNHCYDRQEQARNLLFHWILSAQ